MVMETCNAQSFEPPRALAERVAAKMIGAVPLPREGEGTGKLPLPPAALRC